MSEILQQPVVDTAQRWGFSGHRTDLPGGRRGTHQERRLKKSEDSIIELIRKPIVYRLDFLHLLEPFDVLLFSIHL